MKSVFIATIMAALSLVLILTMLLVACQTTPAPTGTTSPVITSLETSPYSYLTKITAEELKQMMDREDFILVVDVRQLECYDFLDLYIPVAVNIPRISGYQDQLGLLPTDRTIIFYGNTEDDMDATIMAQDLLDLEAGHDPSNIKILLHGIDRWIEFGYPYLLMSE